MDQCLCWVLIGSLSIKVGNGKRMHYFSVSWDVGMNPLSNVKHEYEDLCSILVSR